MKKEVTICVKCISHSSPNHECTNERAPVSSYISGFKYCRDINKNGNCKYYEKQGIKNEKNKREIK